MGLTLEESPKEEEDTEEVDGLKFTYATEIKNYFPEIEIDYQSGMLRKGFVINNGRGKGC